MLLVAAGLLLRSLANVVNADPGFEPQRTLAFDLSLPDSTYPNDEARFAFSCEVIRRIRTLPGVEAVGTGMGIPFGGGSYGEFVRRDDQAGTDNDPTARINYVSHGYLEALGTRLLAGRRLRESDNRDDAARVAVVNEIVVKRFFPHQDPIGQNLSILGSPWQIVGVVAYMPDKQVDQPSELFVYVPHVFNPGRYSIVVRTKLEPMSLVGGIRREIQHLDPGLPLANVRTLDRAMDASMSPRRMILSLIGAFAVTALLLACIGLYGVMSYSVSQQARELCIRSALGAQRSDIIQLVLMGGMKPTLVGILAGLLAAFALGRLIQNQLFEVKTYDPFVLVSSVGLLAGVAALSIFLPARRAANTEPMIVLRHE